MDSFYILSGEKAIFAIIFGQQLDMKNFIYRLFTIFYKIENFYIFTQVAYPDFRTVVSLANTEKQQKSEQKIRQLIHVFLSGQ